MPFRFLHDQGQQDVAASFELNPQLETAENSAFSRIDRAIFDRMTESLQGAKHYLTNSDPQLRIVALLLLKRWLDNLTTIPCFERAAFDDPDPRVRGTAL